jgi:hypothetical protein
VQGRTNQLPRRERRVDSSETSIDKAGEDAEQTGSGAANMEMLSASGTRHNEKVLLTTRSPAESAVPVWYTIAG